MVLDPRRLKEVFVEAAELPADRRAVWLEAQCAGDAELRERLEALLRAHEAPANFLRDPAPAGPEAKGTRPAEAGLPLLSTVEHVPSPGPGTVIAGRYTLVERIGEGGMGEVWVAKQSEPVKRKVALKLIKPGMDSRAVVARFEQERQALALMDHPNIARVLDGGETSLANAGGSPRPFFVMELVNGLALTRFCDEAKLGILERLELYVPVCQAVQHAHQKGIVHRDLKPSNVLVTLYDGKPVPKVIDFGVAKATGGKLTEESLSTQFGAVLGTLEYMAPEQAGFSAVDVDTRADIYSLGVILYELLTGLRPFDSKRLRQAALDEVMRILREEEPPRPSTRLSTDKSLPSLAAARQTEPRKLTALVRGELDWIVMRCLEKDRGRRYETANGLSRDVQRYLANEPVEACPPSAGYRLRKFVRRNRGPMAAAGLVLLALVVGLIGTAWGLVRAERARAAEAERAEGERQANAELAVALEAEGRRRRQAREALDALSSQIVEEWLSRQQAKDLTEEQKRFLGKALESYEEFARDTGEDEASRAGVAAAYYRIGNIRAKLGQLADAEAAYRRSADLCAHLAADFTSRHGYRQNLATSYNSLGALLAATARRREAEATFRAALAIRKQLAAELPDVPAYGWAVAGSYTNLGAVLKDSGRPTDAEAAYRAALAIRKHLAADFRADASDRQDWAKNHHDLGLLLADTGRPKEAEAAYRNAQAIQKRLAAEFPTVPIYRQELAISHATIGRLLTETSRPNEAEASYRRALAIQKQLAADFPTVPGYRQTLAGSYNNLGILFADTGRPKEAEAAYRDALAILKDLAADLPTVPAYRQGLAASHLDLGNLLAAMSRPREAESAYRDARAIYQRLVADIPAVPDYRYELAFCHNNLGILLADTGRPQEAEAACRDALAIETKLAGDFPAIPDYQNQLAGTLVNLGNLSLGGKAYAAARRTYEEALPHHRAALQANPRNSAYRQFFRGNCQGLAQALIALGDHRAAAGAATELLQAAVDPARDAYNGACFLALCVPLAGKDKELTEAKRTQMARTYADRAMAALRQAVRAGYKDAAHMKKDTDLDPLRNRADFRKLLSDLEKGKPAGK
jgi:serine/threonine protein kinase/tetratricopeptide (TPR) repeat protein